jgi:hypothetical protein
MKTIVRCECEAVYEQTQAETDTGSKIPPTARFAVMSLARGTATRCCC